MTLFKHKGKTMTSLEQHLFNGVDIIIVVVGVIFGYILGRLAENDRKQDKKERRLS